MNPQRKSHCQLSLACFAIISSSARNKNRQHHATTTRTVVTAINAGFIILNSTPHPSLTTHRNWHPQ